jgi:hypothetical protein
LLQENCFGRIPHISFKKRVYRFIKKKFKMK